MVCKRLCAGLVIFGLLLVAASAAHAAQGYLQVNVNVDADVYVNDQYMGKSSPASVLNIMQGFPAGSVTVRVEAAGYKTVSRNYSILDNQWTQAAFYLEADTPVRSPPALPPRVTSRPAAPPRPAAPAQDPVERLLARCREHHEAKRLTTPANRNAADCYTDVLRLDPANRQALAGLERIEATYVTWTRSALSKGQIGKARNYLSRLERLNPTNPRLLTLAAAIDEASTRAAARREPAPPANPPTQATAPTAEQPTILEMVHIGGGCFNMGSPADEPDRDTDERLHQVCLDDFELAKNEVTIADFTRFTEATGYRTDAESDAAPAPGCFSQDADGGWSYVRGRSWHDPGFRQEADHPVVCVSWGDALAYVKWLNTSTGQRFRLPTEAEWEYAARAGDAGANPWRGAPDQACTYGSVADERASELYKTLMPHPCEDGYVQTAPVGRFRPNTFGLFDTMTNVSEWTCSYYNADYNGSEDKCARSTKGGLRVNRGAAWNTAPAWSRYSTRMRLRPGSRADSLGFRLARDAATRR